MEADTLTITRVLLSTYTRRSPVSILSRKQAIRCFSCGYSGLSRIKGTRIGPLVMIGLLVVFSICCWPLFLVTGLYVLWAVLTPTEHQCPKCWSSNTVPS